jgi:membrane protein implicated in regulation of membrane protease activity
LGFTTGAAIYGLIYPSIFPQISAIANIGATIIPELWNLNSALVIIFFSLFSLFLFYLIDRARMQRRDKMVGSEQ